MRALKGRENVHTSEELKTVKCSGEQQEENGG